MNRQLCYSRPVSDDRKNYLDLSSNTFKGTKHRSKKFENAKQIPVPLWRKVSYPASLDVGKRSAWSGVSHSPRFINFPNKSQITYNCRVSLDA